MAHYLGCANPRFQYLKQFLASTPLQCIEPVCQWRWCTGIPKRTHLWKRNQKFQHTCDCNVWGALVLQLGKQPPNDPTLPKLSRWHMHSQGSNGHAELYAHWPWASTILNIKLQKGVPKALSRLRRQLLKVSLSLQVA
jgi:hypothetical protein